MMLYALITLIIFDIAIIISVFYLFKMRKSPQEYITEISEERLLIQENNEKIKNETEAMLKEAKSIQNKIIQYGSEIEKEINGSQKVLTDNMNLIINDLSNKFSSPIELINKKEESLNKTLEKIKKEKLLLSNLVKKAEKICLFIQNKVPYEEIMKDIELKKYSDTRKLLGQGLTSNQISNELGISESEVLLIKSMVYQDFA